MVVVREKPSAALVYSFPANSNYQAAIQDLDSNRWLPLEITSATKLYEVLFLAPIKDTYLAHLVNVSCKYFYDTMRGRQGYSPRRVTIVIMPILLVLWAVGFFVASHIRLWFFRRKYEDLSRRLDKETRRTGELQKKLDGLSGQRKVLEGKKERLFRKLVSVRRNLKTTKQTVKERSDDIKRLRQDIDQARDEKSCLERKISELKVQNEKFVEDNNRLNELFRREKELEGKTDATQFEIERISEQENIAAREKEQSVKKANQYRKLTGKEFEKMVAEKLEQIQTSLGGFELNRQNWAPIDQNEERRKRFEVDHLVITKKKFVMFLLEDKSISGRMEGKVTDWKWIIRSRNGEKQGYTPKNPGRQLKRATNKTGEYLMKHANVTSLPHIFKMAIFPDDADFSQVEIEQSDSIRFVRFKRLKDEMCNLLNSAREYGKPKSIERKRIIECINNP